MKDGQLTVSSGTQETGDIVLAVISKNYFTKGYLKGVFAWLNFPPKIHFHLALFSVPKKKCEICQKNFESKYFQKHMKRYDIFYTIYIKIPFYKRGCGGSWDAN